MGMGVLTLVGLAVGGLVVARMVQRGFSAREEPSALEAHIARTLRSWSSPAEMRERSNPLRVTPEVMAEARAHWADHCAGCHANDGSGDTPFGRNMFPRPPDMRRPLSQALSDGELYAIIQNGVRLSGMPAFGEPEGDDPQTWALVAFIRHLPELSPEELKEMKKLNPKSVHEMHEEQLEREFLDAQDIPEGSQP
jgi:cytochrome c553